MEIKSDKYVCTLSPELIEQARVELNEVPERRDDDIEAIREWLRKRPYINADTSAKKILAFLRVSKFSIERAKEKIELYYKLKEAIPEIYSGIDPRSSITKDIIKSGINLPLDGTDKLGRKVILSRPGAIKTDKWTLYDVANANNCVNYLMIEQHEECAISGVVVIQDNENYSPALLAMINFTLMKKLSRIYDCMPIRMKGSHNLHNNKVVEKAYNIFKPFINEKIRNRMFFHSSLESLTEHIPKEILPEEYGGNAGSIQSIADRWYNNVLENADWIIEQQQYRTDMSKKPGSTTDLDAELFGIQGSFRKLDID